MEGIELIKEKMFVALKRIFNINIAYSLE